ncbi:MAG: TRAP transporter small permease [Phreatobacter sp.]|jgi:TRAP-type C4-dicarboxylate transport system permease small subunit|uniref:TRAP transporter small permease n=1 Tax=Phreatobacter sp. TaxID=1966341 RepID=UPI002736DC4E|nr:TRAP transporter small permease [Phreatobacter sp.]MDP2801514.1 TRAP transporter small permease [Phreatobacter sp.]
MRSFHHHLGRAEAVIAGSFLVLMVVLIFAGGVGRLMGYPLNWSGDAATALFAWACFLSADIAWRHNAFMSVDLLIDRLTPSARHALVIANHLIVLAFLAFIVVAGLWLAWISRARTFQGIPNVSYSIVTLSLPIGCALMFMTSAFKLLDHLKAGPRPATEEQ